MIAYKVLRAVNGKHVFNNYDYSLRICYVPVETAGDIMVKENR